MEVEVVGSANPATTVLRLLAPNPGLLTGPGTNTYLIVSEDECAVLDPGPVIDSHFGTILEALSDLQPRAVIVTHTHSDHSPLANPLAAQLGIRSYGYAGGPDFDPDRILRDGDRLRLGRATLEVIHTPGHSSDHLCFLVGDTLLSGDHIMGGSTVVVEEMSDYLRSLRRVGTLRPARLLPGHGHAIENPAEVVAAYLDHRMAREGQIVAAIRDGAPTVGAVVEAVYSQVDRRLHPAAAVSVMAHLRKLTADGIADLAPPGRGAAESSIWSRRVSCRESRP